MSEHPIFIAGVILGIGWALLSLMPAWSRARDARKDKAEPDDRLSMREPGDKW